MSIKKDIYVDMGAYLMGKLKNFPPELNLPDLAWFDKQMGQFTSPELFYAIPLPCILMEFQPFSWQTVGKQQQRGTGNLRFYLYFENYADSFTGSVNSDMALRFFEYTEQMHQALQGLAFPYMTSLDRVADNEDNAQDMIITSTVDYATIISDIATDYSRNYEMVDADVTVVKVPVTSRPPIGGFIDGFVIPNQ